MITESMIDSKIEKLKERYILMRKYLEMKYNELDYHGVEDAASDIRDILAAIEVLEELKKDVNKD